MVSRKKKPQLTLVVSRSAIERAFSRAAEANDFTAMEAADRLLALCDEEGHDALAF